MSLAIVASLSQRTTQTDPPNTKLTTMVHNYKNKKTKAAEISQDIASFFRQGRTQQQQPTVAPEPVLAQPQQQLPTDPNPTDDIAQQPPNNPIPPDNVAEEQEDAGNVVFPGDESSDGTWPKHAEKWFAQVKNKIDNAVGFTGLKQQGSRGNIHEI